MDNPSQAFERQLPQLKGRRYLILDPTDQAIATLSPARICADDATLVRGGDFIPQLQDEDLAVIFLPKSRERLRFVLAALAAQKPGLEVWLIGLAKGGVKGGATELGRVAEHVQLLDSARHCKLYRGFLRAGNFALDDWWQHWQWQDLEFASLPGVFSHGRLDAGSQLLLDTLAQHTPHGRGLDVGCGAGVLSLWLARQGCQMTGVDVSLAALASARRNAQHNGVQAEFLSSDVYAALSGRFDFIVTNPPFHEGMTRTTDITRRLIGEAPRYLVPGGSLYLVANLGLGYEEWLKTAFRDVTVLASDKRFRVWRAR